MVREIAVLAPLLFLALLWMRARKGEEKPTLTARRPLLRKKSSTLYDSFVNSTLANIIVQW